MYHNESVPIPYGSYKSRVNYGTIVYLTQRGAAKLLSSTQRLAFTEGYKSGKTTSTISVILELLKFNENF